MDNITIAFFGTPEICIPYLTALKKASLTPDLIITAPDKPVGRKKVVTPPPVKRWADENAIDCQQPIKLKGDWLDGYLKREIDIAIVIAYGKIFPEILINHPKQGTLNVHYSLLPRWRGASPVNQTILEGDTETGVSIQKMVYTLDAGPIISDARIELTGDETTPELLEILSSIGSDLLIETLPLWLNSAITPKDQDANRATFCSLIKREDGEVNLEMSAEELWRRYRAYYGWPGIFFFTPSEKRVKILHAEYIDGEFIIHTVTPEGKEPMSYQMFLELDNY